MVELYNWWLKKQHRAAEFKSYKQINVCLIPNSFDISPLDMLYPTNNILDVIMMRWRQPPSLGWWNNGVPKSKEFDVSKI